MDGPLLWNHLTTSTASLQEIIPTHRTVGGGMGGDICIM